jgi:hypothetical protein
MGTLHLARSIGSNLRPLCPQNFVNNATVGPQSPKALGAGVHMFFIDNVCKPDEITNCRHLILH